MNTLEKIKLKMSFSSLSLEDLEDGWRFVSAQRKAGMAPITKDEWAALSSSGRNDLFREWEDETHVSDNTLDVILKAWPRLTWWQRKHIFLMCFHFVQRNRFTAWISDWAHA